MYQKLLGSTSRSRAHLSKPRILAPTAHASQTIDCRVEPPHCTFNSSRVCFVRNLVLFLIEKERSADWWLMVQRAELPAAAVGVDIREHAAVLAWQVCGARASRRSLCVLQAFPALNHMNHVLPHPVTGPGRDLQGCKQGPPQWGFWAGGWWPHSRYGKATTDSSRRQKEVLSPLSTTHMRARSAAAEAT